MVRIAPGSVDLASAGCSAVFNVGIASGSFLGGLLLSGPGVHVLPLVAAGLTAVALAIASPGRAWPAVPIRRSRPHARRHPRTVRTDRRR